MQDRKNIIVIHFLIVFSQFREYIKEKKNVNILREWSFKVLICISGLPQYSEHKFIPNSSKLMPELGQRLKNQIQK